MAEPEKPPAENSLKAQRDRFLALAFASADLFIEVSGEGRIIYTTGAAKSLTGIDHKTLMGRRWVELFSAYDQAAMMEIYDNAKAGLRVGPVIVNLNEYTMDSRKAVFTGIRMPDNVNFYVTLALSSPEAEKAAGISFRGEKPKVLNKEDFEAAAQEALLKAKAAGQHVSVTVVDIPDAAADKERLGEEIWNRMKDAIGEFLVSQSLDGRTAGELMEGRYSIIHDKGVNVEGLREKIQSLSRETDPAGTGIKAEGKSLSADLKKLSTREISRALLHTVKEFESKGSKAELAASLNAVLDSFLSANIHKAREFQGIIERTAFTLAFQPIVDLKTGQASHFEILVRFGQGDTQEWISFAEDAGLAPKFDLALCERAINYIKFKAGGTWTKFSVNLSGQSIENEKFFEELQEMLAANKGLQERLMFEITESSQMENLKKVNRFITELQSSGYKIALDDFGAGSASFQYLQELNVDYVKIDGKYIRKILTSPRDAALVKNLTQMCHDIGTQVIAEYVENKEIADLLSGMGIEYGQGYYFAKPGSKPDYIPPKD
ncbi:MAG: EAL domain-containing protein [Alphaproteobacteria bacterium]|nr:EAL domain-containing protein [Alphaproteobacteria bacterium]